MRTKLNKSQEESIKRECHVYQTWTWGLACFWFLFFILVFLFPFFFIYLVWWVHLVPEILSCRGYGRGWKEQTRLMLDLLPLHLCVTFLAFSVSRARVFPNPWTLPKIFFFLIFSPPSLDGSVSVLDFKCRRDSRASFLFKFSFQTIRKRALASKQKFSRSRYAPLSQTRVAAQRFCLRRTKRPHPYHHLRTY